jgi:alkaline phosphatase
MIGNPVPTHQVSSYTKSVRLHRIFQPRNRTEAILFHDLSNLASGSIELSQETSESTAQSMHSPILRIVSLAGVALATCLQAQAPKNVFVMISDGTSFGAWDATDLFQYGAAASASYYGPEFNKYLMTTDPLNTSRTPTFNLTRTVGYDPDQAWGLASYNTLSGYIHQGYTDSAAAGTALAAGQKTFNSAINWSNLDAILSPTLPEYAKAEGKVVGTISSVQWSHATPAAFSNAHSPNRNDNLGIANQMLDGSVMDLIMGAGHPLYNNNGAPRTPSASSYRFVGGEDTWNALVDGTHAGGWSSIDEKADFEALAAGDLSALGSNRRLVGTAQVAGTLQQSRSGYAHTDTVGSDPFNTNVPTLATMTQAALNTLSFLDEGMGMFLQIEGGAIDWAAHANQTSRIIEEQMDFNDSVDTVIAWIEANGGWGENLLIVTTDHGNGMPMGDQSDTIPHDRIDLANIEAGTFIPGTNPNGVRWWTGTHTNELVPLFARGAGADLFDLAVVGTDPYFGIYYPHWVETGFDGRYIDNTDVYWVTMASMAIPEPSAVGLLGMLGVIALTASRRRRA